MKDQNMRGMEETRSSSGLGQGYGLREGGQASASRRHSRGAAQWLNARSALAGILLFCCLGQTCDNMPLVPAEFQDDPQVLGFHPEKPESDASSEDPAPPSDIYSDSGMGAEVGMGFDESDLAAVDSVIDADIFDEVSEELAGDADPSELPLVGGAPPGGSGIPAGGGGTSPPSGGNEPLPVISSAANAAGAVLYAEDFNALASGSNPAGWFDTRANNSLAQNESLFAVYDVNGNRTFGTQSTETNIHSHYTGAGSEAWAQYEMSGRMRITANNGGVGVTLLSDFPTSDRYYRLRRYGNNSFHIDPHGTQITNGTVDTLVTPVINVWYWFRTQVEDDGTQTIIRARVWADGSAEPSFWQVECYDAGAARLTTGTVGLWSYLRGSKYWDNLEVRSLDGIVPNGAPQVTAGPDQGLLWPLNAVRLVGQVTDDGQPNPPGTVAVTWSAVSGSGQVAFGSANSTTTTAEFSAPGTYRLRLTADDGALSGHDELTVQVVPQIDLHVEANGLTVTCEARIGGTQATGLPAGTAFTWDFGEGTATGVQASHTYGTPGTYLVSLMVALGGGLGSFSCGEAQVQVGGSTNPSILEASFSAQAVMVDGTIAPGEWAGAGTYSFDAGDLTPPGVVVAGALVPATDTSATVYLKHDAQYLYVAVSVTDDNVVVPGAADQAWDADCVEVFLDHDNSASTNVGINRLQFDVAANGKVAATQMVLSGSWNGAATRHSGGYVVEYRIAKAAYGLVNGGTYGFDLNVADYEPAVGSLQTRYWYFSTAAGETNESLWGSLRLVPEEDPGEDPAILVVDTSLLDFGGETTTLPLTLSNGGQGTISYVASSQASWIQVSPAQGAVVDQPVSVNVTVNRSALAAGAHQAQLRIDGGLAGSADVMVTATVVPGELAVTPTVGLTSTGMQGGPFSPVNQQYTLSNPGGRSINWTASAALPWVTVTPSSGTLARGASAAVTVGINGMAANLLVGSFNNTVTFTNVTDTIGTTDRVVSVTVSAPSQDALLAEDFNSYAPGSNPVNWLDTDVNNSMNVNDTLFSVMNVGSDRVFGTASTLANIHSHYVGAGSDRWTDYEYTGRMRATESSSGFGVTFLSNYPHSDAYYRLRTYAGIPFHIDPHGTTMTAGVTTTGVVPVANQWYHFRIQVQNTGSQTVVRAKVWQAGAGEPAAWQIDCYDANTTRRTAGTVGVWAYNVGAKYWDDLRVTGVTAPPTTARIQASTTGGQAPLQVSFEAVPAVAGGTLPAGTFNWNFGDSTPAGSGALVTHTFANTGTFTVALSITLAAGGVVPCDTLAITTTSPAAGALSVSPADGLTSSGPQGGPSFTPVSKAYTLTNSGSASINWTAGKSKDWLTLSATQGTLAPGATATVTATINTQANSLPAGAQPDTVSFTNTTNGAGNATRPVALTVVAPTPGTLSVTPAGGVNASGTQGGPFSPSSQQYTLSNTGSQSLNWKVIWEDNDPDYPKDEDWVTLSAPGLTLASDDSLSGTLNPAATVVVTATINSAANSLSAGSHNSTLTFTNQTNSLGNTTRTISLNVQPPGGSGLPMHTASRTSGVAPLAVFFDATKATNANVDVIQPTDGNYGRLTYNWDFGDASAGSWTVNGRNVSKNTAIGFTAAHVYETAGTYTVALVVTDTSGNTHRYQQQISVQAFPANSTYYVSNGGNDANDGSMGSPFRTLTRGISALSSGKRLLLQRGSSFDVSAALSPPNNTQIGAYGTGNLPVIRYVGSSSSVALFGLVNHGDVTISDLQIYGTSSGGATADTIGTWNTGNLLCLRLSVEGGRGMGAFYGDHLFLVDSTVRNSQSVNLFANCSRLAMLGNLFDGSQTTHNFYGDVVERGVIVANRLRGPSNGRHNLRVAANKAMSRSVTVTDNDCDGGGTWLAIHLGSSSGTWSSDAHCEDMLLERNTVRNAGTLIMQNGDYHRTTIRGNDLQGGVAYSIGPHNDIPDNSGFDGPRGVWFCDNTITNSGGTWFNNTAPSSQTVYVYRNTVNGQLVVGNSPPG